MGDFRDGLVAGLLQTPPSDDNECAGIKRALADDLERQRQMFSEDAMHLTGDFLASANSVIDDRERDLTASPGRPLTLDDMRFYACLEIQARIRQMLDADVASGRLAVRVVDGKQVIALDALVSWAVPRIITVEQPALPGCEHSLVDDSYHRLYQQLSGVAPASKDAGEESPGKPQWVAEARTLAKEYLLAWREKGFEPTGEGAALYVEGVFINKGVLNSRGEFIDRETIKREALAGITGNPRGYKSKKPKVPPGQSGKLPKK